MVLVWSAGDKLPPALLLAGPAGVGKFQFAEALAQAALCADRTASNEACGICHPCRLFLAGAHPDVRVLEASATEESGAGETAAAAAPPRIIGVERIRELRDFIEMSSHLGGRKVVLINPAERLHISAANALLKTLEEPSQGTVFALVSARPQQLLPTLRSRCFRVDFRVPSNADALSWQPPAQRPLQVPLPTASQVPSQVPLHAPPCFRSLPLHLPLQVPAQVPTKALSHWPRQVPSQVLGGRISHPPSQAPGHLPTVAPAQVASGAVSSPLHRLPQSRAVSIDSAHTGG